MNSNHSSKALLVLVALLVAAGTANAVTISTDAPVTAEAGSSIEATFTFDELYQDYEEWTLRGETNLTDVTWTVTTLNQAGSQVDQASSDGATVEHDVSIDDNVAEVRVEIDGTVPAVDDDEWSYDPPQQTVVATFEQTRDGGSSSDIGDPVTLRPYTEESDRARQAIDDADATIADAGGDDEAENKLQQAIAAYDEGSFGIAEDLANEAADDARSSQERSQLLRMAGFGLGAVVLLAIVGGGLYWYRSNRTGSRL